MLTRLFNKKENRAKSDQVNIQEFYAQIAIAGLVKKLLFHI
jgi:hypothetical protein